MDVTMVGLHNAGKTSLLRVLSVCVAPIPPCAGEAPVSEMHKTTWGPRFLAPPPAHSAFSAFSPRGISVLPDR